MTLAEILWPTLTSCSFTSHLLLLFEFLKAGFLPVFFKNTIFMRAANDQEVKVDHKISTIFFFWLT